MLQRKSKYRHNPKVSAMTKFLASAEMQYCNKLAPYTAEYNRPIPYLVRFPKRRAIVVKVHYFELNSVIPYYLKTLVKIAAAQALELGWKTIRVYQTTHNLGGDWHFSNPALPKTMDRFDCPVLVSHLKASVQHVILETRESSFWVNEKKYKFEEPEYTNIWEDEGGNGLYRSFMKSPMLADKRGMPRVLSDFPSGIHPIPARRYLDNLRGRPFQDSGKSTITDSFALMVKEKFPDFKIVTPRAPVNEVDLNNPVSLADIAGKEEQDAFIDYYLAIAKSKINTEFKPNQLKFADKPLVNREDLKEPPKGNDE